MSKLFDSFWRAVLYCLHPRVMALSLLPVAIMGLAALGLAHFFWAQALEAVRINLESYELVSSMVRGLESLGLGNLNLVLAPAVLLLLAIPLIVVVALLSVAVFMTPTTVTMVAKRRFPQLERKKGGSLFASFAWSLGQTLLAAVALLVTTPLWLIPPLIFILPPLIWGWLTYRVMSYDALAEHASGEERRQILHENRFALLGIGVVGGYLGAAPSLLWVSGAMVFVTMAPVFVPLAIWIYTLVFAFSSLWFTHYTLAALEQLRQPSDKIPKIIVVALESKGFQEETT
ncbi:hypothetical protein AwPolaro_02860 [Polaromonas sp.]|nr:hypothetical protein AwPolaro_02860 [Polaromonas sp.]